MRRGLTQQTVTVDQLERELRRERHRRSYRSTLLSTVSALVIVAAVAVLVSMLALPVLQVVGESMTPLLHQGEIVIAPRGTAFQKGDVIAFYFNNKILVKRVIANAGEWVNIDADGNVFINDEPLEEPYLTEKARGDLRDGRSPKHQLRQPQHGGGLRGPGADRGPRHAEGMAAERIRRHQIAGKRKTD